jgi:hypothetical protein
MDDLVVFYDDPHVPPIYFSAIYFTASGITHESPQWRRHILVSRLV